MYIYIYIYDVYIYITCIYIYYMYIYIYIYSVNAKLNKIIQKHVLIDVPQNRSFKNFGKIPVRRGILP